MPYEPRALRLARSFTAGAVIVGVLVAAGFLVGTLGNM
jgi:hypothetical protein